MSNWKDNSFDSSDWSGTCKICKKYFKYAASLPGHYEDIHGILAKRSNSRMHNWPKGLKMVKGITPLYHLQRRSKPFRDAGRKKWRKKSE